MQIQQKKRVIFWEREEDETAQAAREYDKRYFPRWEANKRVEYHEEQGAAFRAYTKDLSPDGASIFVLGDPPARHHVKLRIHLDDKEHFEARGRLVWSKPGTTHKLFGIAFGDLGQRTQELIMRHAFEPRKDLLLQEIPSSASSATFSAAASADEVATRRVFA